MKRLTFSGTKEAKPSITIREITEKLTEYEDLEEQRKLQKLPCAVKDTVYTNYVMRGWNFRKKTDHMRQRLCLSD